MNNGYAEFLKGKRQSINEHGFEPVFLPDCLFDFQRSLAEWSIRKGRAAVLADCGLGKGLIQLVWAQNVLEKTNRPVLIVTPLAVSHQMVREGEKFGIKCVRSADGKHNGGIVVTNYERLHYFNATEFAGVSGDECFAPDTLVDTWNAVDNVLEEVYIKDIRPGTKIRNVSGVDNVKRIWKRRINGAVRISTGKSEILCSENHLFFTVHGWKRARDIRTGDYLMATKAAMCLVRGDIQTCVCSSEMAAFLRKVLLSEMANESSGAQGESTYARNVQESTGIKETLVGGCVRGSESCYAETIAGSESFWRTGGSCKDIQKTSGNWAWSDDSRWKWARDDEAAGCVIGIAPSGMESRICYFSWQEGGGVSNLLQSRFGVSPTKDSYRGGWSLPQGKTEGIGHEEGCKVGTTRVESVAILELGHSELDSYRDANGDVYFYDIEAERHPSFSVHGNLVHNSSAIKAFDGKRRKLVTRFLSKLSYRLLCTATAAPNDYIELGTNSEALGVLTQSEMLSMFFKASDNARHSLFREGDFWNREKWFFKAHSRTPFWRWVCSWAKACRMPSDLGYEDGDFKLPPLNIVQHVVPSGWIPDGELFVRIARTLKEQREERRRTMTRRCERVAELVDHSDPVVIWCQYNDEGDQLEKLIPDAVQVAGRHTDDEKESRLREFSEGRIRVLVTKQRIGGWGLNWQHCSHQVMFPSHSWEGYYQGIRRSWRFGQRNSVKLDIVTTEGEAGVTANLQKKQRKADEMFASLVREMNNAQTVDVVNNDCKTVNAPAWL